MKELKEYNIPFVGLSTGLHRFDYVIETKFFDYFEFNELNNALLKVELAFDKRPNLFDLRFSFSGVVNVNCDVSNEEFDLPLEGDLQMIVKFGEEYSDENPEILIIPHGEYELNVAQYIYEMIVLSLPLKKIHPGIEDGTLVSETLDKLAELSPGEKREENENVDPRWDKLKKLLTGK